MVKTYTISNTSTSERDEKKRLAEYLWTEINKAILKSPDVQFSIKKLQKLELLDYVAEFNLVLEVDKLIESILKKNAEKETKTKSILEELHIHAELGKDLEEKETLGLPSPSSSNPSQWADAKPCQKMKSALKNILTNGSMRNTG